MSKLRVCGFGISLDGEIHPAITPALLGRGEHLFAGIDTVKLGYKCTERASSEYATHVVLTKSSLTRSADPAW